MEQMSRELLDERGLLRRRLDRERRARRQAEAIAERATRELYNAVQGLAVEIEQRRQAEEELRRHSQERLEAERFKHQIAERIKEEERIKSDLLEKEMLLKEVHHRVKNNLQIITSLLSLQSNYIADPHVQTMMRECQMRVRSMALIHEQLYRSGNLAKIDFADYVEHLTSNLFSTYSISPDRVQLTSHVDHVTLDTGTAIYCGLLISELVTNCLKHAFPDGRSGEIHIRLQAEPDKRILLSVSDNGLGLPPKFDLTEASSMGMLLVQTLTEQLQGAINFHRDAGLRVEITFAVPTSD